MTKTVKSAVAMIVSGSLIVSTAVMPVAAQTFRAGQTAEAGSAARASFMPSTLNGVQPLANALIGSASLVPALSPAMAPAALALALPAAAQGDERRVEQQPAKQPSAPIAPKPDAGPRWVKVDKKAADAGPRWVGPQKSGLRSALSKYLPFLGRSGQEMFDGSVARKDAESDTPSAAKGEESRASGLSKPSARSEAIVNDYSLSTPEAARQVGEIRRTQGAPLWAKIAAPLSAAASVAVAASYGALPVVALGAGLLGSVLLHELAHIWVLHKLGDRTSEQAGSYSLNPLHLIDPFKTIILPALSLALSSAFLPFPLIIGAGKPVDVDFNNLHSPFGGPRSARNAFYGAGAGPLMNLALAGAFAGLTLLPVGAVAVGVLLGLAKMNLFLTVFNMLPLPQLDGGKMLASALPEGAYSKWVYNPRVEKSYQGMFRRLYEGPTALLTFMGDKLGINSQKTLNRVAGGMTFAALAACYAVAYFHFAAAIPLLFLALPCTYDYWCIREKVRSEAAVNDIMQLYSEWAAVIAQIAEDKGMESEVSLFEAEHAMKNALETLVDEMMAKEEFRALSKEDKLAAIMKAYPDKAAEFLKEKVFTEAGDTLEKVKALLADPRNEAYMNRLRKWFEDHNIFERWDNPKYEGKLKDAMKDAGKEKQKSSGQGGFAKVGLLAALAAVGGAAVFFPELAQHVPAMLSGLGLLGFVGSLSDVGEWSPQPREAPLAQDESLVPYSVALEFSSSLTEDDYGAFLQRTQDFWAARGVPAPPHVNHTVRDAVGAVVSVWIEFRSAEAAADVAGVFRGRRGVARVRVPAWLFDQMSAGTPSATPDQPHSAALSREDSLPPETFVVQFSATLTEDEYRAFARRVRTLVSREPEIDPVRSREGTFGVRIRYTDLAAAAEVARVLRGTPSATRLIASAAIFARLSSEAAPMLVQDDSLAPSRISAQFRAPLSQSEYDEFVRSVQALRLGSSSIGTGAWTFGIGGAWSVPLEFSGSVDAAAQAARAIRGFPNVSRVLASAAVFTQLTPSTGPLEELVADEFEGPHISLEFAAPLTDSEYADLVAKIARYSSTARHAVRVTDDPAPYAIRFDNVADAVASARNLRGRLGATRMHVSSEVFAQLGSSAAPSGRTRPATIVESANNSAHQLSVYFTADRSRGESILISRSLTPGHAAQMPDGRTLIQAFAADAADAARQANALAATAGVQRIEVSRQAAALFSRIAATSAPHKPLVPDEALADLAVVVEFASPVTRRELAETRMPEGMSAAASVEDIVDGIGLVTAQKLSFSGAADASQAAEAFLGAATTKRVLVSSAVHARLTRVNPAWETKVRTDRALESGNLRASFVDYADLQTLQDEVNRAFPDIELSQAVLAPENVSRAIDLARFLADSPEVKQVVVSPVVKGPLMGAVAVPEIGATEQPVARRRARTHVERVAVAPAPAAADEPKLKGDPLLGQLEIRVRFAAGTSEERVAELVAGTVHRRIIADGDWSHSLGFMDEAQAAAHIRRLEALPEVAGLLVSEYLMGELDGTNARADLADAEAVDSTRWQGKIVGRGELPAGDVVVAFKPGVSARAVGYTLKSLGDQFAVEEEGDGSRRVKASSAENAAEVARTLAGRKWVESVSVAPAVRDRVRLVSLPAKVSSHGKEDYSVSAVLVRFALETGMDEIKSILGHLGDKRLFRMGDSYVLNAGNLKDAAEAAQALAANEAVAAVEVHPNVADYLEDRSIKPYPDAESYDPAQSFFGRFKDGTDETQIKEYAELRHLRLVYPKFRGKEGLALFEVPNAADAAATRQILVDETLDEGSLVAEVLPFKEQPGEVPVVASEAAKAKAAARSAAVEAQAEAEKNPPRRDPAAEWLSYLSTHKMVDGTTLNDAQIKTLATFLRPLAKNPSEPRPPVVARTEEVKRMLPIVTSPRGMRNSVILVGEAGTGKTAVAEGLAEMIEDAEHAGAQDSEAFLQFQRLKGRWLVELDINKVLTAEDPVAALSAILDILPRFNDSNPSRGNEVIVLMDEIQKFFLDNNGQKIANVLKGPLRDGKLSVIATTTRKEYKDHIEKDDAFRRRFEKIDVEEPTVAQTITILRALKGYLQKIHDAFIPDESLTAAAKLSDQFDKTNFNPDKAIKAVQDGAELARPDNLRAAITLDVRETWNQLVVAVNEARQALMDKGIASTLALPIESYNRIADLIKKAESLYAEREAVKDGKGQVTLDVVKRVIAQKTGIGSGQLNMGEEDAARYNDMEKTVGARVVNQLPALTAIANAIRRNKAGLSNPSRPMGKFLLTGPTGVGKTYLAKELARFLFKDPEAMIRLDMSEYMEEHTAQRLTGSPPGYVGYGEGGQLTEAVRKKPYSVILFDEVEKAHPKVFDVLLQILDDGRLTDGEGRTIDFKNTVIIMTSNAGMGTVDGEKYAKMIEAVEKHNDSVELRAKNIAEIESAWDKEIDEAVAESLKARFRPEFLNRLDEDPTSKNHWIRVNRLRRQDMTKIASLQIKEFKDLLLDRHDTELQIDPSVIDFLTVEGFSPLYGARPMTSAIEKHIVDPMAKWILDEAAQGRKSVRGGLIKIKAEGGKIVFEALAKPEKKLERSGVEGASRQAAAEVFALIERLVGEGEGTEPSEGLFDKILRSARPASSAAGETKTDAAAATRAFFAPGAALSLPASARTGAALHNKPKAADALVRAEIKAVTESVEKAGWDASVVAAVSVPSGAVGEGWLKQFVSFAKGVAEKAGAAKPLELSSSVTADAVRLALSVDAELTQADQAFLAAHFTGTPPASYEAAQRMVDDLNLHSAIVRNHYLLDLYRRLRGIPGARMGYASASSRTQIWLEIRKEEPKPADVLPAPVAAASEGSATPHQAKEMAKLRGLFLRFIDQSRLEKNDQDGISIRIAAAESYARLAGPEEAELMRTWIRERGWTDKTVSSERLGADSPLAMTAALVLQRLGGFEDAALLEGVLSKTSDLYGDAFTPLKTAFIIALSEVYKRAGLAPTRAASMRASQISEGSDLVKQAARRALGALGYPADLEDVRSDGEALAQLYKRMGKSAELVAEFRDDAAWLSADAARKAAILKLLGETAEPDQKVWDDLRQTLQGRRGTSDRSVLYAAAQGWADLVARTRLTKGLFEGMELYLTEIGIREDNVTWPVLLAYVLALEKAGRAEDLPVLERLLSIDPGYANVHYRHEQAYFAAAEAWAKVVVRSGKLAEYSRPRMGEDGAPKPSRLQEMLTSKGTPLLVAAALRAMALSRDSSFKEKPVEPKGDAPNIHPDRSSSPSFSASSSSAPRGPSNPRLRDDWPSW